MSTSTRRPTLKWHPPPPPTPRIINFPRRHRRRKISPKTTAGKPLRTKKLEALFDEERSFFKNDLPIVLLHSSNSGCERRERVVEEERERCDLGEERETERVIEVEMLRAECRFLRIEREVVLKKMENDRVKMERMICSAVHSLLSSKKKIVEQKRGGVALEEEIDDLAEKLMKLHRGSQDKDFELRSCSNFDKQVSLLQERLKSLGGLSDQKCAKEVREIAEASLCIETSCRDDESRSKSLDMEVLTMKMKGLSKGMLLERMEEEYDSLLSTANSSVTSSASTSKRMEFPDSCSASSSLQFSQEVILRQDRKAACSGRCKAIVRRIVEQVRAETEQWSQMQTMLEQVKAEMAELQASRDFWEDQAIDSGFQIQTLHSSVNEWKQKALASEDKASELYAQLSTLQAEIQRTRLDQHKRVSQTKPPISLDEQIEKEKRVLICRLKENHHSNSSSSSSKQQPEGRRKARFVSNTRVSPERSPFRDIGNSSPLVRQINRAVSSLHCS